VYKVEVAGRLSVGKTVLGKQGGGENSAFELNGGTRLKTKELRAVSHLRAAKASSEK